MNTKNKLIEKLLTVAKKHKILTYPVLALVAVISVFHYLFSWSTGAGKRVVAVVMVLVMLVSQSYFLTSSATALVDTEETVEEQLALQEKSTNDLVDDSETTQEDTEGESLVEADKTTESGEDITSEESSPDMTGSTEVDTETEDVTSETATEVSTETTEDQVFVESTMTENQIAGEGDFSYTKDDSEDATEDTTEEIVTMDVIFSAYKEDGTLSKVYTGQAEQNSDKTTYTITDSDWEGADDALGILAVEGFTSYDGWFMNDDGSGVKINETNKNSVTPKDTNGPIRLYAQKKVERYYVVVNTIGGSITSISEEGCEDLGDYEYAVVVQEGKTILKLQGVKKTGYTLAGASVASSSTTGTYENITEKTDNDYGQDIDIILEGNEYKQNVNLLWEQDPYIINYEGQDENGSFNQKFNVTYDGEELLLQGSDVKGVENARKGYEFAYWTVDGLQGEFYPGKKITSYAGLQEYLYTHPDAVLEPYYTYCGVEFDKTEAVFQYNLEDVAGVTVSGKYVNNSGNENFIYSLTEAGQSAASTLESSYGIKVVPGDTGVTFKTLAGGPTATNTQGIDVEFMITDENVEDVNAAERTKTGTVKVRINQCAVTIAPAESPTKTYDATTTCTTLPEEIPVSAGGKTIPGIYVTYGSCEYDDADAGERNVILKNVQLTFNDNNEKNNYTLVSDNGECRIKGTITKRNVFVKTAVSYKYGTSYVRAGESENPNLMVVEDTALNVNGNGFLGDDSIEGMLADDSLELYLSPERNDAIMKSPDETITYNVLVRATASSNYNFILNSADTSSIASFVVKLEALTDNLYQISTTASTDGWYGGSDNIQLQPIADKGYNQIRISEGGAWESAITLTKDNTVGNQISFQLRNGQTGAYTAWKTITVKIDQDAPEYVNYSISEGGTSTPGNGLFFPSEGETVSFGNYFNKTVKFSIMYRDIRSTPEKLYYTLSNTLGDGTEKVAEFGEANVSGIATAEFEILAGAVNEDKIGTIKFWAEDEAGNKETAAHEMVRNGSGEWAVETTGPEIVSWGVKSGEITVISDADRYYANCVAYLTAQDMTAGVYSVTWYINDDSYEERVSVTDSKVMNPTFEKEIDADVHTDTTGKCKIYAVVTDNAGNTSLQTDPITFMVDDEKPEVDVVENYDTYQQEVRLEFTTYDKLSGIQYIKVEDEKGEADYTVEPAGTNEEGYDVSYCYMETTKKGNYYIEVADKAGNVYKETITLDKVSSEVPPCPQVTFSPEANENEWITNENATAIISNVTETIEDKTLVETQYQLWIDGETPMQVTTLPDNVLTEEVSISDGVYKLRVWSKSKTGVLCDSTDDAHVYTIQVDSKEPAIEYQLQKSTNNTLLVSFTVKDEVSGVNGESIQVMHGSRPMSVQITELEDGTGFGGSFEIAETGNYSVSAKDIAGNEAKTDAFTPMSMKVNAVKNILNNSATVGARIIQGTYNLKSASISYRKYADTSYTEAEAIQSVDVTTGNTLISAVLSNLEKGTAYVYKITAVSEADEVLEYTGHFRTISGDEKGIMINGIARYADGRNGYITVGLYDGASCIRTDDVDTSKDDSFVFENVPDGNYSIVATDGTYTRARRVLIKDGIRIYPDSSNIILELSGMNTTSVETTTDDTPNVTADLDELFEDDTNYTSDDELIVENGGTVEFKLYATLMKVSNVDAGAIAAMYSASSNKDKIVGAYLDLSLYKIVTDEYNNVTRAVVHQLAYGKKVSVTIPLGDLANKSGLEVVRIHQNGDTYTGTRLVDQDNNPSTYTITTDRFSTYAVLYDLEVIPEEPTTESTTEPTTEEIKDGTLNPSDDGTLNITTEDNEIPEDDKSNNNKNDNNKKPASGGNSSVGSLKSSGSAKTGDETPIVMLFGLMMLSMGGIIVLRKKIKDN